MKTSKRRWMKRIILLLAVVVAAAVVWSNLAPTLSAQTVTQYMPYTVTARDIATSMSLSGTVEILHSQSVTVSESTTVKEVYVESSQAVAEGDKLLMLEDGRVLTASIDGVVNQIRARAGGYAMQGMTLVQICDLSHLQITMSVDEYDISSLSLGQPCSVYILPLDMTFETEIAHINRVSTGSGSMAFYTASIELEAPEALLPGMQASVTIPVKAATEAASLPVEALAFDDAALPYVYTASGADEYEKVSLTLGINDGMYVQITEGAALGDTVYAAQTVELKQEGFSLTGLYKQIFGETVVINAGERTRGGNASRGQGEEAAMQLPEGMPQEMPDGLAESPFPDSGSGSADGAGPVENGEAATDPAQSRPERQAEESGAEQNAAITDKEE